MGKRPVPYKIMDFKHRINICTMKDVVQTKEGTMELTRADVYNCWAYIHPVRLSMFDILGNAIQEDRNERTHEIIIRNRRDMDYSSAAWAYEKRLKSGDRWYKLTRCVVYEEDGEYMVFDARLVERGDTLSKPATVEDVARSVLEAVPMPPGVKLN